MLPSTNTQLNRNAENSINVILQQINMLFTNMPVGLSTAIADSFGRKDQDGWIGREEVKKGKWAKVDLPF